MRFNPKARLDTGRVNDGGGSGGGLGSSGGNRSSAGLGMLLALFFRVGWKGKIAIVIIGALILLLGFCGGPNILGGGGGGAGGRTLAGGYDVSAMDDAQKGTGRYESCKTGEDANNNPDCARVAVENSLTDFWSGQKIQGWQPISSLTTFTGSVSTQCGDATSDVGPFYCPADLGIYEDTTFFDQVLKDQLGGPAGAFVEPYVLAHEYGHHISNLQGFMGQVRSQETGPTSPATRLELQADCYAGLWTQHATTTKDANGEVLILELSDQDIQDALDAAAAVGDDSIQKKTQGQTNPETWNHGSSAQRMHWFKVGYEGGDVADCDTFAASEDQVYPPETR